MADGEKNGGWSVRRATRFYIPLLVQAFSQSLTYPLVAAVVSHGPDGTDVLTAFAQGQLVMFMIGSLSGGLVTTGMVFARTRAGYANFKKLTFLMMAALLGLQTVAAMPPFCDVIFEGLLNLPPRLAAIARDTLFWGLPLHAAFFLRNISLSILFNARESAAANNATFVRIAVTLAASFAFVECGLTGPRWGLFAMTFPVFIEFALSHLFSQRYVRRLPEEGEVASVRGQLKFAMPLSLGGFLLSLAPFMVAAFAGRSAGGVSMLAVHYTTIGVANAFGFASLRMQTVAIQFPPEYPGDRRVLRYAIAAGAILGACLLVPAHPLVAGWYFRTIQNIPAEHVAKAQIVMLVYAFWPALQSVRGCMEGIAAVRRRPKAILAGQVAYIAAMASVLGALLRCGAQGWWMGACAILSATAATVCAIRFALGRQTAADGMPVMRSERPVRTSA